VQDPQLNLLKTCISILKHSHSRTPLASHHASPSRISILAHSHPRTLSNRMNVLSTTLVISTLSLCVERCCTLIARHTHRFTLAVCSHTHIHSHSHIITAICAAQGIAHFCIDGRCGRTAGGPDRPHERNGEAFVDSQRTLLVRLLSLAPPCFFLTLCPMNELVRPLHTWNAPC
jgi:hypothetical protein